MAEEHDHEREIGEAHAVTPLELFFDLVFVFALTQVTTLLAEDLSWVGMLRGLAVLAAVWWASGTPGSPTRSASTTTSCRAWS
jgi:low temperature requirement protein LtrA